jgi:hypothetical protein
VDVREHTSIGNCYARQKLSQLLIIPDCQLNMAGNDSTLLVVSASISSKLQHLQKAAQH